MAINCDCVRLGPGWWQDMYFGGISCTTPACGPVVAGDHSWVESFLASARGAKAEPLAEADRGRHPGFPNFNVLAGGPAA